MFPELCVHIVLDDLLPVLVNVRVCGHAFIGLCMTEHYSSFEFPSNSLGETVKSESPLCP